MTDFFLLQPSCDIHLVLDPNFKHNGKSLNNLPLTVFDGKWQGLDNPPIRFSRNFKITPVTGNDRSRIHCDFYPRGQKCVTYDPVSGELRPLVAGQVFMQVRLDDPQPSLPNRHHYIIARIQVHQTMNGWWFGNNSLSVFRDDTLAHSQVSIYALFDKTNNNQGVVGDITGHGYIELSSSNPAIVDISHTYQDRIQGKTVGKADITGRIQGPMLTQEAQLHDVQVVDFADAFHAFLEAHQVQFKKQTSEQHNILFLAEGFADADKGLFQEAVTRISEKLLSNARHSPYNLLKDSFNIWRFFSPSRERGITFSAEVMASGKLQGWPIEPDSTLGLNQLITWVGLPDPRSNDITENKDTLRQRWNTDGSDARLAGYDNTQISDDFIEAWKSSYSESILQARDSFFGLRYGLRWGERYSLTNTEMINGQIADPPPVTDQTQPINAFVQRVHQWYRPDVNGQRRFFSCDWRRYAPELQYVADTAGFQTSHVFDVSPALNGVALILDQIKRLTADPASGATGNDLQVGQLWDVELKPDPNADRRQVNSTGLVCFLVNDPYRGGVNNHRYVTVSLGNDQKLDTSLDTNAPPNVRRLNRNLDQSNSKLEVSGITDKLAHEFGHSFNLGDEYEDGRGRDATDAVEKFDNLTFLGTITILPPASPGSKAKIDADKIKWLKLHRVDRADTIVKRVEKLSNTQIRVTLAPGKVSRWSDGEAVFLRKYRGDIDTDHRQLPINPAADILELKISGSPNTTDNTITLTGSSLPASLDEFRAGSMLYIPKIYRADKLTKTAERISDTQLKVTLELGKVSHWKKGQRAFLHSQSGNQVLELFVDAAPDETHQTIQLRTIHFEIKLPASLADFSANSLLAISKDIIDNSPIFMGEGEVIDYLKNEQEPLSDNFDSSSPDHCEQPSSDPDTAPLSIRKRPCKNYRIIGLYEGGGEHICKVYRPAGACKMRKADGDGVEGEFCFVCKYLIVNQVDPGKHEALDAQYPLSKNG